MEVLENTVLDNEIKVKQLIKQKQKNSNEIYDCQKSITILTKSNQEIDKQLYKLCKHKWERDYTDYGPYSRPSHICQICGLNK